MKEYEPVVIDSSLLHRAIRNEMNDLADNAATGVPKDWAEYQRLVGVIEGLARAERALIDQINAAKAADADGEID